MPARTTDPAAKLAARSRPGEGGCLLWVGARTLIGGYGCLTVGQRWHRAHRLAYELHVGPIPDGHDVDHACGERLCVNPDHLRALDRRVHRRLHARPRWEVAA